jgi:hypothetical protein
MAERAKLVELNITERKQPLPIGLRHHHPSHGAERRPRTSEPMSKERRKIENAHLRVSHSKPPRVRGYRRSRLTLRGWQMLTILLVLMILSMVAMWWYAAP